MEPPSTPAFSVVRVEMVLDNYRLVGELRQPGVPRRLVDTMNNNDIDFLVVENARADDPFTDLDEPRPFRKVEVVRTSVLFAIPRGGDQVDHGDSFETVRKVPVLATIVLPGFEVCGNVHFLPDVKPEEVPMLQQRHFIPVTDARISASGGRRASWNEPVAVVNLAQALFFAVNKRD